MKTTYIYTKPGHTCKLVAGNKPLMLYITFEPAEHCMVEMTIRGSENPFPFKHIFVDKYATDINKWLADKGWIYSGHFFS